MTCVRYGGENARIRDGIDCLTLKEDRSRQGELRDVQTHLIELHMCRDKLTDENAGAEVEERQGRILA
jgi:hypothetical protein